MLDRLTAEDFAPLMGHRLRLALGENVIDAEVLEARELGQPTPRPTAGFSLILRAPADWLHPQGMFSLHHPSHGALDIFLVPIGRDAVGVRYQAIFN